MGSEGWATVGHRGRPVIKPGAGGIEVWRLRVQLWRNRPDYAVVPTTVGGTSAGASVVTAARIALTRFSSSRNGEVIQANQSPQYPVAVHLMNGSYLLRSNMTGEDPATLWKYYMRLTEIEQAFKELKHDLAIRPIFHQREERIEAHIFVSFLAYCLLESCPMRHEPERRA